MKKGVSIGLTVTLMAITATVVFSMTMIFSMENFNSRLKNVSEREAMYEKAAEIDHIVRQYYIRDIDEQNLTDNIARGYMGGLQDPYSNYMSVEEYQAFSESLSGKTKGIGARVSPGESNFMHVDEVYKNSPAFDVGLAAGNLIVKVDNIDISNEATYEEAKAVLTGEVGTKVFITYRSETQEQTVEVTLREYEVPTVYSKIMGKNGVIKITEFNEGTSAQFSDALSSLIAQGADGLIFDVRDNGGGQVDSVVAVLDTLLPEGNIVTIEYESTPQEVYVSKEGEISLPMTVIVNGNTASAAELFAVALWDYGKAKIVGTSTLGKGTIQTLYKLNDGSAIRLTSAKYNPPQSPNYDGIGVRPDVEVKIEAEKEKELNSLIFEDRNEYTDSQLKKAIDTIEVFKKELGIQSNAPTETSSPTEIEESAEVSLVAESGEE
ncbi:MAG: S41 family peptidase [Oscillospiraceae bacterium]|jgi:carboxyl-terminal processing protease|nr:S41 family peptidase [Oscillospiraceae bacterium]